MPLVLQYAWLFQSIKAALQISEKSNLPCKYGDGIAVRPFQIQVIGIHGGSSGKTLDFVDLDLIVPPCCLAALPILPDLQLA